MSNEKAPARSRRYEKKQIFQAIVSLAEKLGRAPSRAEFTSRSGISAFFVLQWFRTWSDAVRAAGLQPYTRNAKVKDRALLEDWGNTVRKNRGVLPRHIYRRKAKYNPCTLANRFGGWTSVAEAFRKFAKGKRKWADVVALLPAPVPKGLRGSGREGRAKARPYNDGTNLQKWGRAPEPLGTGSAQPNNGGANLRANPQGCRVPDLQAGPALQVFPIKGPSKVRHVVLKDRPVYGNPSHFRGLGYEPVNEQGVVLLFGMLAKDLGYMIGAVQTGFPDCEAMRQIAPGRWQRVRIEFEFESKSFHQHGHPLNGCDVIVCWRHNWDACPKHIEVVELTRTLESLGNP